MGILHIKIMFSSSKEKVGCPFSLLFMIMKVIYFYDMDEKYPEDDPFTYALIHIQN